MNKPPVLNLERVNREAMAEEWELLPGQRQNLYHQSYAPKECFPIVHFMIRMKPDMDQKRMEKAMNTVLQQHPALHVRFRRDAATDRYFQKYDESLFEPVQTRHIQESELPGEMASLKRPMTIENAKLYRCGLLRTEQGLYIYFVLHHAISDMGSANLILSQFLHTYLKDAYTGEKDYFFYILKEREQKKGTEEYLRVKDYFEKRFDEKIEKGIPLGLRLDHESDGRTEASLLRAIERKENRDINFFKTAAVLACAWYNKEDFAFLQTLNSDRFDPLRLASAGLFATLLTVGLDISGDTSPEALMHQIREQNKPKFLQKVTLHHYVRIPAA